MGKRWWLLFELLVGRVALPSFDLSVLCIDLLIGYCLVQLGMGVLWQRATGFTVTSLGL